MAFPRARGTQDIAAGGVVVGFAVAVLFALARIPTAKYQAIGPDLFPRVCAWLLIACGIALLIRGLWRRGASFAWPPWRSTALIVLAVVAFGLAAPRVGYAIGGFLTIVIAGFAVRDARPVKLVVFAAGMIAFSVVLFSVILKVPMPAFAWRGLGL
jgi:hypothetical protein